MRAALGFPALTMPLTTFIAVGVVLGPYGINLMSVDLQALLDPVLSLALATLGVFAGLGIDFRSGRERKLLAAATVEALVTVVIVGGAALVLFAAWKLPFGDSPGRVALALGVCAAASAALLGLDPDDAALSHRERLAELDDVILIVLGGIALVGPVGDVRDASRAFVVTLALGAGLGCAGWLLFEHAQHAGERGVFVLGTLLLLAGGAAYLRLSPILAGMIAGIVWRWSPGHADRIIDADLRKIQHPLVALLLIVAGASAGHAIMVWLFAVLIVFRASGKIVGAALAARLVEPGRGADLGAALMPCGVLGIALALHFRQVSGAAAAASLVPALAGATVVFELVTPLVGGRR